MKKIALILISLFFIQNVYSADPKAKRVRFTPIGTIAATNVQDAIEEVAGEAGAIAWDDIGNPDAASEIDFADYITELKLGASGDFRIGDGGSNYVKYGANGSITFVGTADIDLPDNSVDDADLNLGTGANQISAVDLPIVDSGSIITATEVEGALQENRTAIDSNTSSSHTQGTDTSLGVQAENLDMGGFTIENINVVKRKATCCTVHNNTGASLVAGICVYPTGVVSSVVSVAQCDNTDKDKMPCLGIISVTIADGNTGCAVCLGIKGMNTSGFTGAVGDRVYVQSDGTLDTVEPTSGSVQRVGVLTVKAADGQIYVHTRGRKSTYSSVDEHPIFRMGSDAGHAKVEFRNYANAEKAYIDDIGKITAQGGFDAYDQNITNVGDIAVDSISADVGAGLSNRIVVSNPMTVYFPGMYFRADGDKWQIKGLTGADRYTLQTPARLSVDVDDTVYFITAQTDIDLSTAGSWDTTTPTDYTVAATRAGKDFYIYACQQAGTTPVIVLSANSTVPSGYTADNSRKIGGFHCVCVAVGTIASHDLTGFLAGDVLPASVWDIKHRPTCTPEGMVYDEKSNIWVDIYLASGTGASTASVYGGTISDTRNWMDFVDDGGAVSKRMLKDREFQLIAAGSNEETNITGSADPGTTGGHVDTASRRMISNIGAEDCCGALNQWLGEQSSMNITQAAGWYDLPGAKGSLYRPANTEDVKLIAGGGWGHAANAGSRCRHASYSRWGTASSLGCRFASEPVN